MRYYETIYIVDPNLENTILQKTMTEIGQELEKTKAGVESTLKSKESKLNNIKEVVIENIKTNLNLVKIFISKYFIRKFCNKKIIRIKVFNWC